MFAARSLFALLCPLLLLLPACSRKAQVSENPLVITPQLAVAAVEGKSLYYNAPAEVWLMQKRPEFVPAEDHLPNASRPSAFAQAVQNHKLFRQLDRQLRFDSLLLVGDPSQYRPLLEHLLDAGDWHLAYLDHTSLIFRREGAQWSPEALKAVWAKLPQLEPRERALVAAQMAVKLVAVRQLPTAREQLETATQAAAKLPEAWSAYGQYHLALGEWKKAESDADKALELDPENLPALGVKAQALYATKRFAEAYRLSTQLVQARPEDPGILFYHAKIAHEAKQYADEINAMETLIKLARKSGRVDPGYHVYLGQAFAGDGQAENALAEFSIALADPELSAEQRKFAEDTSTLIRQKVKAQPK